MAALIGLVALVYLGGVCATAAVGTHTVITKWIGVDFPGYGSALITLTITAAVLITDHNERRRSDG